MAVYTKETRGPGSVSPAFDRKGIEIMRDKLIYSKPVGQPDIQPKGEFPDLLVPFLFHHVGLACRSLFPEILSHKQLGYVVEGESFYDPIQKIRGVFMLHGPMRIELLEPSADDSPVTKILARGQKMYHQAFTCTDIYQGISYLEARGARVISPPAPALAFGGKEIVFIIMRTLLIVELIEA